MAKISRPIMDALLDLSEGRVIVVHYSDWGGSLKPRDLPEKRCRVFLGNVKTVTIRALEVRKWIAAEKLTYEEHFRQNVPLVYRLTEAGHAALAKARGESPDAQTHE